METSPAGGIPFISPWLPTICGPSPHNLWPPNGGMDFGGVLPQVPWGILRRSTSLGLARMGRWQKTTGTSGKPHPFPVPISFTPRIITAVLPPASCWRGVLDRAKGPLIGCMDQLDLGTVIAWAPYFLVFLFFFVLK